ncbi:MAG: MAPEG family protein [Chitinophagaceae bacterium]|nr:MAPEG family protein [Oligoflexus sp.]
MYIGLAVSAATKVRGTKWNAGPRDELQAPLTGIPGRLDRASKNFLETFPLFLAAYLALSIQGRQTAHLGELGIQTYLAARVVYLPLYAFGVPYVRSLVWMVSIVGIFMMLTTAW